MVDESAQVDLKLEVAEKESQSVVISKDGGVQTDGVAFQDTAMQTKYVEKVDKSIEVNLKPEVAEEENKIMSEDEGIYSGVSDGSTDEDCFDIGNELVENNYCEVHGEDDEALKEQLEDISQELELERLQNASLKEENRGLQSVIERLEKNCEEFTEDAGKREEELAEYKMELINKTRKLSAEVEEKDAKINSLTLLNEALEQDKKKIETRSNEQQQIAEMCMKLNELLSNVTEISERTSQLHNQEQQEEKKSLENKILELQKQVQTLEGNKEWELAEIDGIFKEVFSNMMEMLEKGLYAVEGRDDESLKRQLTAQSVEIEELNKQLEKANEELEKLTLSYNDQTYQIADLQAENLSLRKEDGELLYRSIDQIKKLEGALKEKDAQCKQLKESLCALESLEYRLESLESQSTTTKKAQQQRDSSHQTNTKSMAKSEADLSQKNKGRLDKQLQKTKKEPVEQPNEKLTPNTFMSCTSSTARLKNNLTAEKKASVVKKRTNNPYNEKFVQSYTNSLPEDALEKSIKTKAKSLDSSNVQKLAKNISNEFTLPKNTNSTPNSFLSHTSSTASINSLNVRVGS